MTNEYNDLWELDRPVLVTLVTELRAELSAAQAALTQAERELELTQSKLSNARGEASRLQALIERRRIEGDDTRANAAKWEEIALQFQRERDEARAELLVQDAISAMGAKWLVDLTSLRIKYERQRRTIRALVVAARVSRLAAVGFAFIAGVGPRRVHDEIRFGIKQAKQAERGQAGDEQS